MKLLCKESILHHSKRNCFPSYRVRSIQFYFSPTRNFTSNTLFRILLFVYQNKRPGLKARKLYSYISFRFPAPAVNVSCMSLAWHVAVKVVSVIQVTNFPLIKFSSTHKVLTSLRPIADLRSFIKFPLPPFLPHQLPAVGWGEVIQSQ